MLMIKKVVIFGGSGFLGSYLAEELLRNNFKIVIADIKKPKNNHANQKFVKVNILDLESIKSSIKDADAVYNFASIANLDDAREDPLNTININILGNINLLEACRLNGKIKRYIYASSAYALSDKGSFMELAN